MPHMVEAITGPKPVYEVLADLRAAHEALVSAAREATSELRGDDAAAWGIHAKRVRVHLPAGVGLLSAQPSDHAFAEVVNQCATMERLMDALEWAHREIAGAVVQVCHPTTSSHPAPDGANNDLVLVRETSGEHFHFEVSDVASTNDGNRKEVKDLVALGVLRSADKGQPVARPWPTGRHFLVVSSEFAERLMQHTRHGLKRGDFHYELAGDVRATRIIEVVEGERP